MLCRVELRYNVASFSLGRNKGNRGRGGEKINAENKRMIKEKDSYQKYKVPEKKAKLYHLLHPEKYPGDCCDCGGIPGSCQVHEQSWGFVGDCLPLLSYIWKHRRSMTEEEQQRQERS